MGLVGVLHERVGRGSTDTQVFFASSGTHEDLAELDVYHVHDYFYPQVAKERVPGARMNDWGKRLETAADMFLYQGEDPFVTVSVSDQELAWVYDAQRHEDPAFVAQVVKPRAIRWFITNRIYALRDMGVEEKRVLLQTTLESKAYHGRPLSEMESEPDVVARIGKIVAGFAASVEDAIRDRGVPEEDIPSKVEQWADRGWETQKEVEVIYTLIQEKGNITLSGRLNQDSRPSKLLALIDIHNRYASST